MNSTIRKTINENGIYAVQEVTNILTNEVDGYCLFDKNSRKELPQLFPTEEEALEYSDELMEEKEEENECLVY